MMEPSKYLPKQMNGAVINSFMAAVENELTDAGSIESYIYNLSINTAQEDELESIGEIIGYPRPLVPEGFELENILLMTSLPHYQEIGIGLSDINSEIGGRLATTEPSENNYMSLGLYRKFLDKVALIKRYGVTLYSVDQIARLISDGYTIGWDANKDITVEFAQPIGFKNVWILTQLFYKLTTSPQVIIISGEN